MAGHSCFPVCTIGRKIIPFPLLWVNCLRIDMVLSRESSEPLENRFSLRGMKSAGAATKLVATRGEGGAI